MHLHSSLLLIASLTISAFFASDAKAGMSVGVGDLEGVIKSNPRYDSLFIDNLELAPTGEAMRLGKQYGKLSGSPVGPYQFKARFTADSGKAFPLLAILHTEMIFENKAGEVIKSPAKSGDATFVRQQLIRVELLDTEKMTSEEITKALNNLFERQSSAEESDSAKPTEPMKENEAPKPSEPGNAGVPLPLGAGKFQNELKEGDRKYAGEYHCDDYTIAVKAGQTVKVNFQPSGFIPVIMSKKNGKYSGSAGRADGETINEQVSLEYKSPTDAEVIISLTTRDKEESGSYEVQFTLDNKALSPASNGEGTGYVSLN